VQEKQQFFCTEGKTIPSCINGIFGGEKTLRFSLRCSARNTKQEN